MEPTNKYIDIRELLDGYERYTCKNCGKVFYRELTGLSNLFLSNKVCRECGAEHIKKLRDVAKEHLKDTGDTHIDELSSENN